MAVCLTHHRHHTYRLGTARRIGDDIGDDGVLAFRDFWQSLVAAARLVRRRARRLLLVEPGPLTQAHATIDNKDHCQDCHVGARDLSQRQVPRLPQAHRRAAARAQGRARQPEGAAASRASCATPTTRGAARTSSAWRRSAGASASTTTRSPRSRSRASTRPPRATSATRRRRVGHADLSEGADGVRGLPPQPARRSARADAQAASAATTRADWNMLEKRAVRSRPRHALSARAQARAA